MSSSTELQNQIPVYQDIPEDWQSSRQILVERIKNICNAINIRGVGWEIDKEILTGKKYIPSTGSTEYRDIFRHTFDTGTLPKSSTKLIPHGVTVDANFVLLSMWGAATDPVAFRSIPLPNANINLSIDATNLTIKTSGNYSGYTASNIIIEYTTA